MRERSLPWRIGLALSGGGYRASAFHLGVMDYLEYRQLLDRVRMLSTVSGGTFTGAIYAVALAEGVPVFEAFRSFYRKLRDVPLLAEVLRLVTGNELNRPSNRRNLIIAASEVYSRYFFADPDGGPIRFERLENTDTSLEETIFNATEFRTGIAFRFLKSRNRAARVGNGNVSIRREDLSKLRLGDIAAASSCFPGGFEPMIFPDDFDWPDGIPEDVRERLAISERGPIALMDGGIYDNQGIRALQQADRRSLEKLDLYIISDVDQKQDSLYAIPRPPLRGNLRLGSLLWCVWALMLGCLISALIMLSQMASSSEPLLWRAFAYGIPFFLALGTAGAIFWIRSIFYSEILAKIPEESRVDWQDLRRLRLSQVIDMAQLRATSLLALATSVFMKRIRGLVYKDLFGQLGGESRPVSCLIESIEVRNQKGHVPYRADVSADLLQTTKIASSMPTALWFGDADQLPALVATGQATICLELMEYLHDESAKNGGLSDEESVLYSVLRADWTRFCGDPLYLVRTRFDEDLL